MLFTRHDADDERFMRMAIGAARMGIENGQTPFGACVVRNGEMIACEHNAVWQQTDITAHAEIHAIRTACAVLKTIDLSGCVMYSTCEPCPMCFSAIHWARIDKICFGASIADAAHAGFRELTINNSVMRRKGGSKVEIRPGILRDECRQLFEEWKRRPERKAY